MRATFRSDPIAEIWQVNGEALATLDDLMAVEIKKGSEPRKDDALSTLSQMAVETKKETGPRKDLEQRFWKTDDDPLTVRMKAAITALEAICHPAIAASDTAGRSPCDRLMAWLTGWK